MKLTQFAVLSMLVSGSLIAQDVNTVGTITQQVKIPDTQFSTGKNTPRTPTSSVRDIKLLDVQLSDKARQHLAKTAKNALNSQQQFAKNATGSKYPPKVELGMNKVPVLDQGGFGTCVTFANTAAMDAALNKGDYISQLCQLELGNYLEKTTYMPSGWHGSLSGVVLSQMDIFGIVSKKHQLAHGCAGLTQYPLNEAMPEASMTPEEYHQVSENLLAQDMFWSPVLDIVDAVTTRVDTNKTLDQVKAALKGGDRLTFGVLLLDFDLGFMGAVGKNNAPGDSWVLTPEIARDIYLKEQFGGHEMVITSYNDNAVAVDEAGREHRGLLTLRNSWGSTVGDEGNFYMSYDYFKVLVIEVQRIGKLSA